MNSGQLVVVLAGAARHFLEEYKSSVGTRRSQLACLADELYDMAEEVIEGLKVGQEFSEEDVAERMKLTYAKCHEWVGDEAAQVVQSLAESVEASSGS